MQARVHLNFKKLAFLLKKQPLHSNYSTPNLLLNRIIGHFLKNPSLKKIL